MAGLKPGSTPRRWEPERGTQQLRDRIHKESKFADDHKNLPFTFSKPPRRVASRVLRCVECGYTFSGSKNTVCLVCPECKKVVKVEELNYE